VADLVPWLLYPPPLLAASLSVPWYLVHHPITGLPLTKFRCQIFSQRIQHKLIDIQKSTMVLSGSHAAMMYLTTNGEDRFLRNIRRSFALMTWSVLMFDLCGLEDDNDTCTIWFEAFNTGLVVR
jgi:hypothetical protein